MNVTITDPPRAGMDEDVIKTIMEASPEKVVYVSCNPATQTRDLALMDEMYKVMRIQPVDMFPHTPYGKCGVAGEECGLVCLLIRWIVAQQIRI